jgi:hypothetical protein
MNMQMKTVVAAVCLFCLSDLLFADGHALLLPGTIVAWENEESIPAAGVSLKRVALPDGGVVALGAIETRVLYSFFNRRYRLDVSWPNLFGFLYPGLSLEVKPGGVVPWVYGEVDLFYFPFAFMTIMLFEKPAVIPSVYIAVRTNGSDGRWETGVRLSFPLHRGDE